MQKTCCAFAVDVGWGGVDEHIGSFNILLRNSEHNKPVFELALSILHNI